MKINSLQDLLEDKRVIEEINKHLWIESQKAGHNIGLERAKNEWLNSWGMEWMKFNLPEEYQNWVARRKKAKKNEKNNGSRG